MRNKNISITLLAFLSLSSALAQFNGRGKNGQIIAQSRNTVQHHSDGYFDVNGNWHDDNSSSGSTSSKKSNKKSDEKYCAAKFLQHRNMIHRGGFTEYTMFGKANIICDNQRFDWNKEEIEDIPWKNYFKCFDNMRASRKVFKQFHIDCLNDNKNEWMITKSPFQCFDKLVSLGFTKSPLCFNPSQGKQILSSEFDDCRESIKSLDLNKIEQINTCSKSSSSEILACYDKLKKHLYKLPAWNRCTSNQNIRYATKSVNFEKYMTELLGLGATTNQAINLTMNSDTSGIIKCIKNNSDIIGLNESFNKCTNYNFRRTSKDQNFQKCYKNTKADGFTQNESINMCTTTTDKVHKIANSRSFKACKNELIDTLKISKTHAYQTCFMEGATQITRSTQYASCIANGLDTAYFNYFTLRSRELSRGRFQDSNPYKYIFKDCYGDLSNSYYKKRNKYLKFYSDINFHTHTKFMASKIDVGGMSAVRFQDDKMYILSDDKGHVGPARIYVYKYENNDDDIKITPTRMIYLTKKISSNPDKYKKLSIDPEGMDFNSQGDIIISSESNVNKDIEQKSLSVFSSTGKVMGNIKISDEFLIKQDGYFDNKRQKYLDYNKGVQYNKSFESLSLSPDKEYLFTANEDSLEQDINYNRKRYDCHKRKSCYRELGSLVRIVKYKKKDNSYVEIGQYYYRLEKEKDNGLVEVLSVDKNRLITLERSWDNVTKKLVSRIYFVNLDGTLNQLEKKKLESEEDEDDSSSDDNSSDDNSTDPDYVLASDDDESDNSKKNKSKDSKDGKKDDATKKQIKKHYYTHAGKLEDNEVLEKKLLLDLYDIKYQFSPGFRRVDNIEGMAFGPTLPNWKKSLVLVADNNFSLMQRNLIIFLEINMDNINEIK